MKIIRAIPIAAFLLVLAGFQMAWAAGSKPKAAPEPEVVERAVKAAIVQGQKTQKKVEEFAPQRAALLGEISELKTRKRWLDHQVKKFSGYVRRQEETLAELERKRTELLKINRDLEPYLDELVNRLVDFIDQDLVFLEQERAKRTAFLKRSLGDYHLPLWVQAGG